jgi:hypothetical protein
VPTGARTLRRAATREARRRQVEEEEEDSDDGFCDRTAASAQVGGTGREQGCVGAALPATAAGSGEFG